VNAIIERVRALLAKPRASKDYITVPVAPIADLCEEAEAMQGVLDRIAKRDAERAFLNQDKDETA